MINLFWVLSSSLLFMELLVIFSMEKVISILIWVHILAGSVALLCGASALIAHKGGPIHRWVGKVFFWSMAIVSFTATLVAAYRPTLLLLALALFSFYSAFSGYRALFRKRPDKGQKATYLDWSAAIVAVLVSAGLVCLGLHPRVIGAGEIAWVPLVFGALGILLGGTDLKKFSSNFDPAVSKNAWFFDHMSGMLGAYIAAMTAFIVVNFESLGLLGWLGPTAVGIPALHFWQKAYRKKFSGNKPPKEPLPVR